MSFYSYKNGNPGSCPGVIAGDALGGLSEKVCIQVKRVYDSCLSQDPLKNQEVEFSQFAAVPKTTCTTTGSCIAVDDGTTSNQPVAPIVFESCRSSTTQSEITSLTVERLCDRPCFARVRATIDVPIDILFSDAKCNEFIGRAVVTVHKDVLLSIPDESIVPYSIESMGSAICVSGSYIGNNKFKMTVCVTVVLKVLAEVEILVPSYGFCSIPPCEEFAENVCDEFFSLPLFPPASLCGEGCVSVASTATTAKPANTRPAYSACGCAK
ncbi:MAG: hypothetical protein LBS11_11345 [Oscillospiraceae bacterium]|jgi:hypothetical protein|nr:hypothetical protein [Oscillospiraceae bacterium]